MRRRAAAAAALFLVAVALGACSSGGGITPVRTAFNKGVYHQSRGEIDAAIAEYRAAIAESDSDFRARFNLATALESKADAAPDADPTRAALRGEARSLYEEILAARPGDLRASVNLAAAEYRDGDRDGAKRRLAAAARTHPHAALPRSALAAHLLSEGDAAGARDLLRDGALAADPSDAGANMLLGDALAALGDDAGARSAYERALVREPDDVATLVAIARLESRAGRTAAARASLDRALFIDSDNRAAHALAADLAEAAGDLESAVFHLWRVRDLGGDPGDARLRGLYLRLAGGGG